jgi:hypothetical protein
MFGIPGKAAVTLTPAATRQIARLMEKQGSQGLRIGVKKGGCAGMEYTMEYVTSVNPAGRGGGTGRRPGHDRPDGADVPDRDRDRL